MKKLLITVVTLVVLFAVVAIFFTVYHGKLSQLDNNAALTPAMVERGEYLATMGDCVSCHTDKSKDAQPYAGGLAINSHTVVGYIYSSNITPDAKTGIGAYSLQDFDNAVRYGVSKDGRALYPAMPYTSFASISDDDVTALYAYFMKKVKPVEQDDKPISGISAGWGVNAWRLFFSQNVQDARSNAQLPEGGMAPLTQDALVKRGAYIVEGLGHCGTCHTPRNLFMQEKAYHDDQSSKFLSGGMIVDGYFPVSLRGNVRTGLGNVSQEELFKILKTGHNEKRVVFGPMQEVIANSFQYLTDDDVNAVAVYLKTLSSTDQKETSFVYDNKTQATLLTDLNSSTGSKLYADYCAACHRADGAGYANFVPALAGNSVVQSKNADSLVNIVLQGSAYYGINKTALPMPSFKEPLSDQDMVDLLNFIRSSWGNHSPQVKIDTVKKYRADLK